VEAIAFPVGTERQVSAYAYGCIRAIYNFCFTALNGPNTLTTDPYRLHRDCLPAEAPLAYVQMVMDGTYDLFYRLKMRRLTRLTRGRPDSRAAMPGPNRALRPSLPAALGPSGTGSQRAGNSPP
jgi:hypothetical protein